MMRPPIKFSWRHNVVGSVLGGLWGVFGLFTIFALAMACFDCNDSLLDTYHQTMPRLLSGTFWPTLLAYSSLTLVLPSLALAHLIPWSGAGLVLLLVFVAGWVLLGAYVQYLVRSQRYVAVLLGALVVIGVPILLALADTSSPSLPPPPDGPLITETMLAQARCAAQGGTWSTGGPDAPPEWAHCITPTIDGGTPCTDNDQCEGDCTYMPAVDQYGYNPPQRIEGVTGTCETTTGTFGCRYRVTNGVAEELCVM